MNNIIPIWTYFLSADAEGLSGRNDYLVTLKENGEIYYTFPTVINVMCHLDVTYFPFDEQVSWYFCLVN